MRLRSEVAATVAVLVISGCSGDGRVSGEPPPATSELTTPVSSASPAAPRASTAEPQRTVGDIARRVAEAKALAARERDARPEELVVVRAERVSWPDSAYGCPATERAYEAGPFPGYRIVLAHGDRSFTYTAAEDTELVECLFLE